MKDSEVISSRVCMDRLYWVPPPAGGVLVSAGGALGQHRQRGASRHSGAQRTARREARRRRDFIGPPFEGLPSQLWEIPCRRGPGVVRRAGQVGGVEGCRG